MNYHIDKNLGGKNFGKSTDLNYWQKISTNSSGTTDI